MCVLDTRSADGHFPAEQLFGACVSSDELSSDVSRMLHENTTVSDVWWWSTAFQLPTLHRNHGELIYSIFSNCCLAYCTRKNTRIYCRYYRYISSFIAFWKLFILHGAYQKQPLSGWLRWTVQVTWWLGFSAYQGLRHWVMALMGQNCSSAKGKVSCYIWAHLNSQTGCAWH